MSNLQGKTGQVSASGQIISNGNFTCNYNSSQQTYTVNYGGAVTNPVVLVSLTDQNPMLTYVLNAYAGGFTLYVYANINGTPTPTPSSFNFIVAEIA